MWYAFCDEIKRTTVHSFTILRKRVLFCKISYSQKMFKSTVICYVWVHSLTNQVSKMYFDRSSCMIVSKRTDFNIAPKDPSLRPVFRSKNPSLPSKIIHIWCGNAPWWAEKNCGKPSLEPSSFEGSRDKT